MGAERLYRPGGQLQHAPALAGLGVTLDPHGPVDGHRAGLEIDLIPRDRSRFLGTHAGEQKQDHVSREPMSARLDGLQERDGLAKGHRLASLMTCRDQQNVRPEAQQPRQGYLSWSAAEASCDARDLGLAVRCTTHPDHPLTQ